jgi:tRNA(Ile2) C34 agmatinyltransferase TiaS
MASKFNCPNCGGTNEYAGEGNTVRCQFCGSDVHPPEDMVNSARLGLGGTLVAIFASFLGG